MSGVRWRIPLRPGARVNDTLATWWEELVEPHKNEPVLEIPWSLILPCEVRPGLSARLSNLEQVRWRERAPDYEFVLLYEISDQHIDVLGLRSIRSTLNPDQIFPLPRTKRATIGEAFVRRKYVLATYEYHISPPPLPPSHHIYPLSSNWTELCIAYRHQWAFDVHAFELTPSATSDTDESYWLRQVIDLYVEIVNVLLFEYNDSTTTAALPTRLPPAADDYEKYGGRVCSLIDRQYFSASARKRLQTPAQRLAEWKGRLYAQLWISTITEGTLNTLLMRTQRLALFSILSFGWYRESHIATLITYGQLPVEMWRVLDVNDVGSAGGTWWHTISCKEISWETEFQRVLRLPDDVGKPIEEKDDVIAPKRHAGELMSINDGDIDKIVTPFYQRLLDSVNICATPMPTEEHFSSTTYFSVARSAFLLQPRTHCLLWANNQFHCLSLAHAGALYLRDASETRGQVEIAGLPRVLTFLLEASGLEASQAIRSAPLDYANKIHEEILETSHKNLLTDAGAPLLVPALLSNSASSTCCSKWIVIYPTIVIPSSDVVCSMITEISSSDDAEPEAMLQFGRHKYKLIAAHGNGTIWPLDPLFVRFHPAPSSKWVTDTLQHYGLQQYVGNPRGRPVPTPISNIGYVPTLFNAQPPPPPPQPAVRVSSSSVRLRGDDQWCYTPSAIQHAIMQRIARFHQSNSCQTHALPSCAYLVRSKPIIEHDSALLQTTQQLPHHAVLLYTDIHRWTVALHMSSCDSLAANPPERGTTLYTMREYTRSALRPSLLLIQRRLNEINARKVRHNGRLIPTNVINTYRALGTTLIDNFAEAYLTEAVFQRPPSAVRHGGALLVYGSQQSRTLWLTGEHKGCWFDFRDKQHGHGILGLVAHELFGDKTKESEAYKHAVEWLSVVDPERVTRLTTVENGSDTSSATPLVGEQQLARMMQLSVPLSNSATFRRYLTETRALGELPTKLLEQWASTSVVVALPSAKYYIERDIPPHNCSALLISMFDQSGQLNKIQMTYLTTPSQNEAPKKLQLLHRDVPMPAKKTRNVRHNSVGFAPLFSAEQPDAPILLAEGLETALSVWCAFPGTHVFSAAGVSNWRHFDYTEALPDARLVVLCRDNDTGNGAEATERSTAVAVRELTQRGYDVRQIWPHKSYGDFNDVHRQMPGHLGTTAVRDMVIPQLPELAAYEFEHTENDQQSPTEIDDDDEEILGNIYLDTGRKRQFTEI